MFRYTEKVAGNHSSRGIIILLLSILAIFTVVMVVVATSAAAADDPLLLRTWTVDYTLMIDPSPSQSQAAYDRSGGLSDTQILGGQRDRLEEEGLLQIQWDGDDSGSDQLEFTGLGGVDLTNGNIRDRFELEILETASAGKAILIVYSDEWSASSQSIELKDTGSAALLFRDFEAAIGDGADFTNVGAITLDIPNARSNVSLGSLVAASGLSVFRSEFLAKDINGNHEVDSGDVIEERVVIANDQEIRSGSIVFEEHSYGRADSLINGSATTTQGVIASASGKERRDIAIDIGPIEAGASVIVTFQRERLETETITVDLILQRNDIPTGGGGLLVDNVNYPVTDGDGAVGFTGDLDDGVNDNEFVWHGSGLEWLSTDIVSDVSSIEAFMGVGNGDKHARSIILNPGSLDSAWTQDGKLVAEEDPAPGIDGQFITFASRPTMLPDGTAHWISGYADTQGGGTQNRVLYRSIDTATPVISVVIKSGDVISGFIVDSSYDFDYFFSDNGDHHIQVLDMVGTITEDHFVYLDGDLILREGQPIDEDENWEHFDIIQVNDHGNYLVSGDTDGDVTTDEFIAYNSKIGVREGDVVAGIPLTSAASVRVASINNLGQASYAWGVSGGSEILFFACDASFLASASVVLVTGDMVDVDGDSIADATVTDFNTLTAAQAFMLAEDGKIYLEVDLDYGAGDVEAVIGLDAPFCSGADISVSPDELASTQFPYSQVLETLIISNSGSLGLGWDIYEEVGSTGGDSCSPDDLPWLSVDPVSGTVTASGSEEVAVLFNSTALGSGEYTGTLCIESNDAVDPVVRVPITLTVVPHEVFVPYVDS